MDLGVAIVSTGKLLKNSTENLAFYLITLKLSKLAASA
jgi:hypothetical protein